MTSVYRARCPFYLIPAGRACLLITYVPALTTTLVGWMGQ